MKVEKVSMRSPYCASEMILGYIYSGKNDICWTLDNEKNSWIINHPNKQQVILAKLNLIKGCRIKVFRCASCQIEIIHADLSGNFSYGNKSTLIVFYLIIVLINLLFTFKYEIPLMKELHKMIKSSLVIDIISIFFQFLIIVVIGAFIVKAII